MEQVVAPPREWRIPQCPSDAPEAARGLAAACDELAAASRTAATAVGTARALVDLQLGAAAVALDRTLVKLHRQHEELAAAADQCAQAMRQLADRLAAAKHAHGFSLSRIMKAGAVLVVTGVAVYATMGAATPAAVAAVEAEVAAAGAAAGAAAAAAESAAVEVTTLARLFAGVRGLATFSRTDIAWTEFHLGFAAFERELTTGKLLPEFTVHEITLTAFSYLLGTAGGKLAGSMLSAEARNAVRIPVTALGSGAASAIPATVERWRQSGSFPAGSSAKEVAEGAASEAGSDVAKDAYRRISEKVTKLIGRYVKAAK